MTTGDVVDAFELGSIQVTVRYGCVRRDQYELLVGAPLPAMVRDRLALIPDAQVNGTPTLFVVDVREVHQITVAAARGRIVVMPRLRTTRPAQRAAVLSLCELIDGALRGG